jgi:hypothetical protein
MSFEPDIHRRRLAAARFELVRDTLARFSEVRPDFSTAEMWTNTSLPPAAGWINPYRKTGLNQSTFPT